MKHKERKKKVDDEYFEKIMKEFLPYIKHTAHRLSWKLPQHVTIDDLVSVGLMGLMDALDRYEPGRVKLKTYAELRIKGSMIDEIRATAHIPRSMRKRINEIYNTREELKREHGVEPNDIEVANKIGISLEEYYKILQYSTSTPVRLEDFNPSRKKEDSDGLDILESISDPNSKDPFALLQDKDRSIIEESLTKIIEELPKNERIVLSLYYYEELNLQEIGKVLDITESRVCQIHSDALKKLKISFQKSNSNEEIKICENNHGNNGNRPFKNRKKKQSGNKEAKSKPKEIKKRKVLAENKCGEQISNKPNFLWN